MLIVLSICLLIYITIYLVAPLMVYNKSRQPLQREFYRISDEDIRSLTSPGFPGRVDEVRQLGFERVANLQSVENGSQIFSSIFYRPETLEMAHVSEIASTTEDQKPGKGIKLEYAEFTTRYDDGSEVDTNNSTLPAVLPAVPEKSVLYLPTIQNIADLYAVHTSITRGVDLMRRELPPRDLIEFEMQTAFAKTHHRHCETGYLQFDEPAAVFRPTAKGALLMTWKLLWPVGEIRKSLNVRGSRQIERDVLGRRF